jgi:hypothetical protein
MIGLCWTNRSDVERMGRQCEGKQGGQGCAFYPVPHGTEAARIIARLEGARLNR